MHAPRKVPALAFYYHYKHDPEVSINHHAYEVVGVGHHTEEDCRPEDVHMVAYRPLYDDAPVYQMGRLFYLRPLEMWMDDVEVNGKVLPRFTQIKDPAVIAELQMIRERMYF